MVALTWLMGFKLFVSFNLLRENYKMQSLNVRTTEGCTHWSCFPYTVNLSAERWAHYWAVPSWTGGEWGVIYVVCFIIPVGRQSSNILYCPKEEKQWLNYFFSGENAFPCNAFIYTV